jgi:hypothetical protein
VLITADRGLEKMDSGNFFPIFLGKNTITCEKFSQRSFYGLDAEEGRRPMKDSTSRKYNINPRIG